jgi:hypothetical protein
LEVKEMILQQNNSLISVPRTLKLTGLIAGTLGLFVVLIASLAYIPQHPEFSLFNTFLSTIGDTPGWPQILLNSGILLAAPLRYLVLVLFALRLYELGAGRSFKVAVLVIGLISTLGTVLMTAVPFSLAPSIHKGGIGLYFLGIVVLQSFVFLKQWSMKTINRLLPILSMVMVVIFIVFFVLLMFYEQGIIDRSSPVFFEWMCFFSSIAWIYTQSVMLGNPDK